MKDNYLEWAKVYDLYHSELTEDVEFYIRKSTHVSGRILEIGCGTGRVLFPMVNHGLNVIGIDNSNAMLEIAKQKKSQFNFNSDQCEIFLQDMRDFDFNFQFDQIIIPFNGFLSLLSIEDQLMTLQNVRKHLTSGGRLLFDVFVPDPELLVQDGNFLIHSRDLEDPKSGESIIVYEQSYADVFHQFIFAKILMEKVSASGESLKRLYLDYQLRYSHIWEMVHLLDRSGFEVLNIFGDFNEGSLSEKSSTMIFEVTQ